MSKKAAAELSITTIIVLILIILLLVIIILIATGALGSFGKQIMDKLNMVFHFWNSSASNIQTS